MIITIKNSGIQVLTINDLALEIGLIETIDISHYSHQTLLESSDLPFAMASDDVDVRIDGIAVSYAALVKRLTSITPEQHEVLDTLKHNVSETYYFETTKDINGQTKYITYYQDSSKSIKIKEEEIVRGSDGTVSAIMISQFDSGGNITKSETQTLNRNSDGKVENITVETT